MLVEEGGVYKKYICFICEGDQIGTSGLGEKYVHCFGKSCMRDIEKSECETEVVTSPEEIAALRQEAY